MLQNKVEYGGCMAREIKKRKLRVKKGTVIILGDLTICHKSVSLRYAT